MPPVGGSWNTTTTGKDPSALTSADFSGITTPTYNLFFEAGLQSGQLSSGGSIGLNVSYQTASSQLDILDIALNGGGANVTSGVSSGVSFYALSSLSEGPTENPAELMGISDIKTFLQNDVDAQGNLIAPLTLGIAIDGLAVPTSDMGNGVVADISVDATAEASNVPEPSTLVLLGAGAASLLARNWRRLTAIRTR